jgi:hypothetical protein
MSENPFKNEETLWSKVDKLITQHLGDDIRDTDRQWILDILMDYRLTQKEPHYVVEMIKHQVVNNELNPLHLYALISDVEDLQ